MFVRRAHTAILMATMALASYAPVAFAQVAADLYLSPNQGSGIVVPSGAINITPAKTSDGKGVDNEFTKSTATLGDTKNLLGCGGVGQAEFTSGLYNMPETFGKFQQDVNSLLAKQILAMNYIMPQSAALFDQLNNFGNDRYRIFQSGCNLDSLTKDAKEQYLQACVKELTPDRLDLIKKTLTGDLLPKEPLLSSMAYAQAWEVCTNQYVSDTEAVKLRNDTNKKFAETMQKSEDVNAAIKPFVCTLPPSNAAANNGDGYGCWINTLLPKVRTCYDGTIYKDGCQGDGAYGVKDPSVTMPRLFDIFRFIMEDEIVSRRALKFQQQISYVNKDMRRDAASEAALILSTGTITRLKGNGETFTGSMLDKLPDESVREFQINYLNCKNPNIISALQKYQEKLQKRMDDGKVKAPDGKIASITLDNMDRAAFRLAVKKAGIDPTAGDENAKADNEAFASMVDVALSCTVNQTVPLLDPNLTASIATSCSAQDQYAFYTMAGYDASLAATRDVYRYANLRLKQAYARLLTEKGLPVSPTATAAERIDSPELNARLAKAIKEVMIPYVDSQIERLEEINRTRGEFGRRVHQMYSTKSGCNKTVGGGGW